MKLAPLPYLFLSSFLHSALGGLSADDHPQYLLASGLRTLTGDLAVTAGKKIDGRDVSVDGAALDGHLDGIGIKHNADEIAVIGTYTHIPTGDLESALSALDTFLSATQPWQRLLTVISPTVSGDSLAVNIITQQTPASGVTVESVLIKAGLVDGRDISVDGSALDSHIGNAGIHFTVEQAQDAVALALTDTSTIHWTYSDLLDQIQAAVIQAGIDHSSISNLGVDSHTQYLKADGTRTLAGNLSVAGGITVDGRDISVDGAKLDTISVGAQVNQLAFGHVAVPTEATINAASQSDTVTFIAGTGIALTTNPTTKELTITNASPLANHAGTHVTGGGDTIADVVSGGNSGLMSGADKAKLNGIATGADTIGPVSSTVNAIARFFNSSGKVLKNSSVIIDDLANMSGLKSVGFVVGTLGGEIDFAGGLSSLQSSADGQILTFAGISAIILPSLATVDGVDISALSLSDLPALASGTIDANDQTIENIEVLEFKAHSPIGGTIYWYGSSPNRRTFYNWATNELTFYGMDIKTDGPGGPQKIDGRYIAVDGATLDGLGIFKYIDVAGKGTIIASGHNDTLQLLEGSNVILTPNVGAKSIMITSTGGGGGGGGGWVRVGTEMRPANPGDSVYADGGFGYIDPSNPSTDMALFFGQPGYADMFASSSNPIDAPETSLSVFNYGTNLGASILAEAAVNFPHAKLAASSAATGQSSTIDAWVDVGNESRAKFEAICPGGNNQSYLDVRSTPLGLDAWAFMMVQNLPNNVESGFGAFLDYITGLPSSRIFASNTNVLVHSAMSMWAEADKLRIEGTNTNSSITHNIKIYDTDLAGAGTAKIITDDNDLFILGVVASLNPDTNLSGVRAYASNVVELDSISDITGIYPLATVNASNSADHLQAMLNVSLSSGEPNFSLTAVNFNAASESANISGYSYPGSYTEILLDAIANPNLHSWIDISSDVTGDSEIAIATQDNSLGLQSLIQAYTNSGIAKICLQVQNSAILDYLYFGNALLDIWLQSTNIAKIALTGVGLAAGSYLNFDLSNINAAGYGFRDNSGVVEYKNSGGSWAPISFASGVARRQLYDFTVGLVPPVDGQTGTNFGMFKTMDFDPAIDNDIYFNFAVPDNIDITQNITLILKYCMDTSDAGSVVLQLKYISADITGNLDPVTVTATQTGLFSPGAGANILQTTTFTIISANIPSVNAMIGCHLTRLATDGSDTHTGKFQLISAEIAYTALLV